MTGPLSEGDNSMTRPGLFWHAVYDWALVRRQFHDQAGNRTRVTTITTQRLTTGPPVAIKRLAVGDLIPVLDPFDCSLVTAR